TLNQIAFSTLNSSDADLSPNGIKLYSTSTQIFSTDNLIGSPTNFSGGVASFTALNHNLNSGHTYLWLTYDVALDATHKNTLDAKVQANHIVTSNGTYPATEESPAGERVIYQSQYYDDFEGSLNWTLTGEFQVASPAGNGGSPGNPNPIGAHSGTNALGTDLTGLGDNAYNYEPELTESSAYMATSETFDMLYYKDLNLFFWRHLNIEVWDRASIEISTDAGATWNPVWESNAYINDFQWTQQKVAIPIQYWRSEQVRIRYSLGPTDGMNNYSGWNIDDIFLTGEFISKDVGVSEWIYPQSGSGHTSSDSVTVLIRNYGGAAVTDPVPVAYSFNGGSTWTINQMDTDIPVDGSVEFTFPTRADLSEPGFRPDVIARTMLPGDQYPGNDQVTTEIYIVPTYIPHYEEDFEENDGYWRSSGADLWEYGTPAGSTIDGSASGSHSWITGLSSTYGEMISDANQVIFEDGFETDLGWSFTGEFEREIPDGVHLPWYASYGYFCAGIDLGVTGDGANPWQYENGITAGTAYTATSPPLDVSDYSNLELSFFSWITVQSGDSIRLEISPDGLTWHTIWQNDGVEILDTWYQEVLYAIPDELTFTNEMRIRYSLYYSSPSGEVAQGWSIDNVLLTGNLVSDEPGYLSSPSIDLTGLQNPMITANLWIETESGTDGANLQYSLDDGVNWTTITNISGNDAYWNWYTGQPVSALVNSGWSGHSGQWVPVKHMLPAFLTGESNVQFRFIFAANKADNQYDGIALDDVSIMEAPPDIDLVDIIDPVSACELSSYQTFTLQMRNSGLSALQAGDTIQLGYVIDRSGDIQTAEETFVLPAAWPVGSTVSYAMSSSFDLSHSGEYEVTAYCISSDPHFYDPVSNDTVVQIITVSKPHVDLGEDISTSMPDTVLLSAYSGVPGQTYRWQDLSTDSVFHVSTEGIYYVDVDNGSCVASDTVSVLQLVVDLGVSAYLGPPSACEHGNSEILEVSIENLGTDTLLAGDSIFIAVEINSSMQIEDTLVLGQRFFPHESLDHTYSGSFDFSAPGDYQMKLYTRTEHDAEPLNDTLYHTLQVFGYPDAYLGRDTVVYAADFLLAPASGYAEYLWQDASTGETFLVEQPGLGMYYVSINDINQCTSQDTILVTLNVPDVELEELLSPATSCELSSSITVSARIRNAGNQVISLGETLNISYQIDGGTIVTEPLVLSADFLPGHSLDFTFSSSESVVTGNWYDFTVFVDYSEDVMQGNDTISTSVGVFETPALDLGDSYQVIMGFEYTLDAGPGFLSYEWQDGSTEQTFTITEPGIGNYNVTVTDANACTAYDEVELMLATPDIGILEITHPLTTCHLEDAEHIVAAIQNFGNWDIESSASITISFSVDGSNVVTEDVVLEETFEHGSIIYHTFSEAFDFSEPGTYNILVYTSYGPDLIESNNLALISIDHFGSPIVDIGNGSDTILTYETISLEATPGYPSYLWQDGSTGTSFTIDSPSAAWYKVIITGDNGCETHDSVYVVYDYPDLAISSLVSPVSSCSQPGLSTISIEISNLGYYRISIEDTLTISYTVDGGAPLSEQVFLQSDLIAGQSTNLTFSGEYDFSQPGTYSIQTDLVYTPDQDLSNNTLTTDVESWDAPVVDIGSGQDTLLTDFPMILDAGSGFSSYLWQDLSTSQTYSVSDEGLYWVTVSDFHGCTGSDTVYVTTQTASRPEEALGLVNIYPNPVKEILHVELEMPVTREVLIELYSMSNVLVYKGEIKQANVTEAHIDVQGMAPGVYALKITADQRPHNFLVVVE
ncbi:MAG: T9SS type A sorting domain-containing protein, partial [Bacteroidota bacterium]|nr:T9SS type A sorting domain-containing protein [Bacteroidota bacterium]